MVALLTTLLATILAEAEILGTWHTLSTCCPALFNLCKSIYVSEWMLTPEWMLQIHKPHDKAHRSSVIVLISQAGEYNCSSQSWFQR
jgi:hypothetical protein